MGTTPTGALAGPAHNGDGAEHTHEPAMEEASVIGDAEEVGGIDIGDAHYDKEY